MCADLVAVGEVDTTLLIDDEVVGPDVGFAIETRGQYLFAALGINHADFLGILRRNHTALRVECQTRALIRVLNERGYLPVPIDLENPAVASDEHAAVRCPHSCIRAPQPERDDFDLCSGFHDAGNFRCHLVGGERLRGFLHLRSTTALSSLTRLRR